MAKASPAQLSFSSGELSPLAAARTDSDQYRSGLKTCLNYVTTALGPATHKPGTHFAAVAKDSSKQTRVRRFEFSTEQAYVIEFGNLYCRFYKNNAPITRTAQPITSITKANPAVLTYSGDDTFANGDPVRLDAVGGMEQVNRREFTVANVNTGAKTFELSGVDSSAYDTYTSGGTVAEIYEVATPYLEADLFALNFTQSADVLYIVHTGYAQRKLSRYSDTHWSLDQINFIDGPYLDQNTTPITITPSAQYYVERENPKRINLYGLARSDTQFVAVGAPDATDAYIITSPDGVTWTERTNPKARDLFGAVWSGTQFVAVGHADGTDAYIVTSPDGITWTERANPKNITLYSVAWSGAQFVAVGFADGTDAYIATSQDGITWTERANPKNLDLYRVIWSGTQFVAVGVTDGIDGYIITSPDGITWTERANPKNISLYGATWSGTQFVAVGDIDADAYIVTSPDGMTWTERANPKAHELYVVAWSGAQFIAVGAADGTDAYIISSSDGITWTEQANPKNLDLYGLAWFDTKFVAVGAPDVPGGTDAYIIDNNELSLTASDAIFASTDIGRLVRIKHSATWGYAKIIGYTSQWIVTAAPGYAFAATTASQDWRLGAWSDTTGYPGAVTFYENRLVFGGSTDYPGRIDGSKSGLYEYFAPTDTAGTVADSNAVSFTLNASSVNRIYWLADDDNGLLAGTAGGCWTMRASTLNEALTPTNVSAKRFTGFGSKSVQAQRAGRAVVYAQREGRTARAISYNGKFSAKDISLASSHITKGGLVEMAYMQAPHEIVWSVRADGTLLGTTFSQAEADEPAVSGWHRHTLGGIFGSGEAAVESAAVIPSADGTYDELWMVVKRTINGATVRTIEYMHNFFESDVDAIEDAFFVDCGITYDGAATDTIGGLWHLEGQTVTILADGATHPTKVVSNGKVTLDRAAAKVHVGLYASGDIETLRFEAGAQDGTAQGKTQRIHQVAARLDSTVGLQYGPSFDDLDEVSFRTSTDDTNAAVPLFTGDKLLPFHGDYSTEARICLRQSAPLPSTIVGLYPQIVTQDKG